jgi:hypothetical protein
MIKNYSKTFLLFLSAMVLVFACAGGSFAQGNGKGNGREKRRGVASVFKWPDSWKSDRKSKGNGNLNRFQGLSKKTGHSPESLWAWYESERTRNPRLTHGQFVAANMIARNPRKGITTQTILDGLRKGDSIGEVLQRKGMNEREIRGERDRIRKLIIADREFEYDDLDSYWRLRR